MLIAAMLVVGGMFSLVGAIGMLRFPDFYMRLHAPDQGDHAGCGRRARRQPGGTTGAQGSFGVHEVLITLFLFMTAPVSANLLAKAALHLRVPSKAPVPPEQPRP
jgi:multicomponent K+:H+ antiporter subunit G